MDVMEFKKHIGFEEENKMEEKRNDAENDREDLTISPNHAGGKGIMKNKILGLYDPKNLIVK